MRQNRFKSKVFWIGIVSDVVLLGQLTGLFAKLGLDAGVVQEVSIIVVALAANIFAFGNNPTVSGKY